MEMSNLRTINKERLSEFLKYLENKNYDATYRKCLVSVRFNIGS